MLTLSLIVVMAAARIGPFGLGNHTLGLGFEIASLALGVILTVTIIWWARQRGRFDPFEFPVWISLNVYLQIVLNVGLLQRNLTVYIAWLQDSYAAMYSLAVVLFGVGLLVMWFAYVRAYRRWKPEVERPHPDTRQVHLSSVRMIWGLGWIVNILSIASGNVGYLASGSTTWANYLAFISIIYTAATATLIIWHFRHPSIPGWIWFGAMAVTEVATSMIIGSRSFAFTLLMWAMCAYYARLKLPVRFLVVSGIVVIVLVPVVNDFRLALNYISESGQGVSLTDRLEAFSSTFSETTKQPISSAFESTTDTFKNRQGSLLDVTASALYLHPHYIPFVGGQLAEYFIPQLVPRMLFPSKASGIPAVLSITQTYIGVGTSLAAIGLFADSYRAGGWFFVVIWFSLFGVLGARVYSLGPAGNHFAGTVIYVTLLMHIMRYDGDITTTMLHLIQWGSLLWLVVMRVMFVPTHGRPVVQSDASLGAGAIAPRTRIH